MEEIYAKIDKNFPDNKEKCELICTLLGTSANLSEFVMNNHEPNEIPLNVQYGILIISMNMIGMIGDGLVFKKVNLAQEQEINFKISEQGQEHIYRKMKRAVDIIIEQFKKIEAEYDI